MLEISSLLPTLQQLHEDEDCISSNNFPLFEDWSVFRKER